jgi:RNase P subunit RPR2
MKRKVCPRCKQPCKLVPVSSFDPTGEKLGAVWMCSCGWHSLDHFVEVG